MPITQSCHKRLCRLCTTWGDTSQGTSILIIWSHIPLPARCKSLLQSAFCIFTHGSSLHPSPEILFCHCLSFHLSNKIPILSSLLLYSSYRGLLGEKALQGTLSLFQFPHSPPTSYSIPDPLPLNQRLSLLLPKTMVTEENSLSFSPSIFLHPYPSCFFPSCPNARRVSPIHSWHLPTATP